MSERDVLLQTLLALTAAACALPGVFLVLRRLAMLSDAITHTVLLGIVLAFFLTRSLTSPLLVAGATLAGVLTVWLVELLQRTRLVKEDAAIGLVFTALFSAAVILISLYGKQVHLDRDAVLLGKPELAIYKTWRLGGYDLGPQSLWVMGVILALNVLFIGLFYKELKLATFDAALAGALGFLPGVLHYALVTLVSLTAVGAFEAAGSVLVVGFMIGPAATAYLLTDRLSRMLAWSAAVGAGSAVAGYWLALLLDASIAGSVAAVTGGCFGLAWLFAPGRGLAALAWRRVRQRREFARTMLAIHLFNHEGRPEAEEESRVGQLHEHLRWDPGFVGRVVRAAEREGVVVRKGELLQLTNAGRRLAEQALVR